MTANLESIVSSLKTLTTALKEGARIVSCPSVPLEIPGITAADALDAGDCMGTIMKLKVPKQGIIYSATLWDLDDEGSAIYLEIFKHIIVQIANDAAWAPTDSDLLHFVTELSFIAFTDHTDNQTSELTNIGKAYTAPEGLFYIQAKTGGTPNIAAGSMPRIQLQILSGDPEFKES